MTNEKQIQHTFKGNMCLLQVPFRPFNSSNVGVAGGGIPNNRNIDIFVEDHNFYIYVDTRLHKFQLPQRKFDTKDMKQLIINFNTKTLNYEVNLPCLPQSNEEFKTQVEKGELEKQSSKDAPNAVNLWKLNRITEQCQLQEDGSGTLQNFVADYGYGFARRFKGKIQGDIEAIARMPEPQLASPLQRSIDREIDELKDFSRDQYKLNFIELQVPEGHDNPMKFIINFEDDKLSADEQHLLHNLTCKSQNIQFPTACEQTEVDCELVSILLAICYDIRLTSNDPTCESAWTRSTLSATLSYFEPFGNLKDVVISFLRRTLIYPLYRNYDFGRLCVQDAIKALHKNRTWVLKQLLLTNTLFANSDINREIFNRYYIDDYIRYVHYNAQNSSTHLQTLSRNLKNVLLDVCKKHLGLDLGDIETELLKELITDIHIGNMSTSEDEADNDDDEDGSTNDEISGDEDDSGDASSVSSSATEENSVIEQFKQVVNI